MKIRFEWDEKKAESNQKKHGISFDEAKSVFYDDNAIQFFDEENSSEVEDRFIMLGMSLKAHVLVVCHCIRENDGLIRIFSARKATKVESKFYSKE